MTQAPSTVDIPKKPAARRAWVKFQLEIRSLSLRAFANREGVSHQAVSNALMGGGSRHLQEAIAREINLTPQQLFPELYDDLGNRLGRTRPQYRITRSVRRNVEEEAAA